MIDDNIYLSLKPKELTTMELAAKLEVSRKLQSTQPNRGDKSQQFHRPNRQQYLKPAIVSTWIDNGRGK